MIGVVIVVTTAIFAPQNPALPTPGEADAVVQQLKELPAPWAFAMASSNGEPRPLELLQDRLYDQLRQLGDAAWPALSRGLSDPDVRVRRSVLVYLTFGVAFGPPGGPYPHKDYRPCLPALVTALKDDDEFVRMAAKELIEILSFTPAIAK